MVIYWYCSDTMASTVLTLENYKYITSLYYVHNGPYSLLASASYFISCSVRARVTP